MRIALVGYGKMGKAVEELVLEEGHTCIRGLSVDADVCIDFSSGGAVKKTALSIEIPWVLGTTGWRHPEVLAIVRNREIPLLYAPNFSIGMAGFLRMAKMGRALFEDFEVEGMEIHHAGKKDAPSGTALHLMEEIEELKFTSVREGDEVGTHKITFKGPEETVELIHQALDRRIFARGALKAAEWLIGKEGMYTFEDYIEERMLCHLQESQQP